MNWNAIRLVAVKEWRETFNSPMPYIFLTVFYLLTGWFFTYSLFLAGQAVMDEFFGPLSLLLVFFIPAFSMRLFAEEYKTGTIEVLATLPIRDVEIVLGKYAAVVGVWLLMLVLSLVNVGWLFLLGRPEFGSVASGYVGALLLGALYASAGLFGSSLTRSQVVGFLFGFLFCFVIFLAGKVTQYMPGSAASVLTFLGVDSHYESFLRGVIDSRDVVYFLSGIVLFLSGALASFNSRRWR